MFATAGLPSLPVSSGACMPRKLLDDVGTADVGRCHCLQKKKKNVIGGAFASYSVHAIDLWHQTHHQNNAGKGSRAVLYVGESISPSLSTPESATLTSVATSLVPTAAK